MISLVDQQIWKKLPIALVDCAEIKDAQRLSGQLGQQIVAFISDIFAFHRHAAFENGPTADAQAFDGS